MIGKRFAAGIGAVALVLAPVAFGVTSAGAATTACGSACVDVSFVSQGLNDVQADHSGLTTSNNPIYLRPASNAAPKEDFSPANVGRVRDFYCDPHTGQAYPGSVFTNNQCHGLLNAGLMNADTYLMAFNPNRGGDESMCVGTWNNENAASGWKFRLEPCGVAADTVWILSDHLPGGNTSPGTVWAINGGSNNFSNPLVATASSSTQPRVETAVFNGGAAQDSQEVVVTPGPAA
jgi:hypothetical protein